MQLKRSNNAILKELTDELVDSQCTRSFGKDESFLVQVSGSQLQSSCGPAYCGCMHVLCIKASATVGGMVSIAPSLN